MTTITAALVKELRERTNAGMMECKKALVEAEGDIEKAIEAMRLAGQAKAVKKAGRIAAEGTIVVLVSNDGKRAVLVEVNCETDFVAREERFQKFAKNAAQIALDSGIKTTEALQEATDPARLELISALGENITVRRLVYVENAEGIIGAYGHGDANGIRIGVLILMKKGNHELARDLAMHVAAMNPEFLKETDIPADRVSKEKAIFEEQTREEGKPDNMLDKIVAGKLKKFATEISLLGQPYVKDPAKKVENLLKEMDAEIKSFVRFEVGEGIEKKQENFAAEVMATIASKD
jgi:elongation factor Ts